MTDPLPNLLTSPRYPPRQHDLWNSSSTKSRGATKDASVRLLLLWRPGRRKDLDGSNWKACVWGNKERKNEEGEENIPPLSGKTSPPDIY
ncbi:hypothetical protein CEXT_366801 [Caerostris extrusa]|uniref:Uncharacterized protein n=1 Tax=Caerostris extrusa TaxID=172846 RepID=A0AAV4W570_CAEEX|nr:hypothetical protein CEXT_366801 [Caerostris extrusa]